MIFTGITTWVFLSEMWMVSIRSTAKENTLEKGIKITSHCVRVNTFTPSVIIFRESSQY